MTTKPYAVELELAIQSVVKASTLCKRIQLSESFSEMTKKDRSPVTVADFGSQAVVCHLLHENFPNDPMIAEEDSAELRTPEQRSILDRVVLEVKQNLPDATEELVLSWIDRGVSRDAATRTWTLDPIDGTKGFLRKEQYAVALALLIDGQVEVGVLGCPNLKDLETGEEGLVFSAVRGQGAFIAPIADPFNSKPISVSKVTDVAQACFVESVESKHSDHDQSSRISKSLGVSREPVRIDSQAKYAVVSRGDAEIYLRLPTKPGYVEKIWDHAAGHLVVEEAGGKVTDIHGKPLDYSLGAGLANNEGIVATNGQFHDAVIEAIQKTSNPA